MDIDEVNQKFEQLAQLEKEFETVDLEIRTLSPSSPPTLRVQTPILRYHHPRSLA